MKRFIIILFFSMAIPASAFCMKTEADSVIYTRCMENALDSKIPATSSVTIFFAEQMLGTEYVAGTLESPDGEEQLRISLEKTDCILFAENCLAMALIYLYPENGITFCRYENLIRELRYRDGKIDGYTSRLHYTSEWISQAEKKGFIEEITENICKSAGCDGGYRQDFSFMSSNSGKYTALKDRADRINEIRKTEQKLSRSIYHVIPKNEISKAEKYINSGDIIFFNTAVKGLDISHVGIALRKEDGSLHFIHASMTAGKVIEEPRTIEEYMKSIKSCNGLRVARLKTNGNQ